MEGSIGSSSNLREESTRTVKNSPDVFPTSISQVGQIEVGQDLAVGELGNDHSELIGSTPGDDSAFLSNDSLRDGGADNASLKGNAVPIEADRHASYRPLSFNSLTWLKK